MKLEGEGEGEITPETEMNKKISIRIRFDSPKFVFDSIRSDRLQKNPYSIRFDSNML